MRVLGHVHTFNDEAVIEATLAALLDQTYPIDEVIIVDNASTDRTLARTFPPKVKVIRHVENLGTNGSVITGFKYAVASQYDWIWILDADTAPRPDALERLLEVYRSWPPELQKQVRALSSLPVDAVTHARHHGIVFTPRGVQEVKPDPGADYYECEANMWSGTLFRVPAITDIGLPDPDFVLDFGDIEYGYRGSRRGYKAFICPSSEVLHNLHPRETLKFVHFGGRRVKVFSSAPIRFYYLWRNTTFFWLHEFDGRSLIRTFVPHVLQFVRWLVKATLLVRGPLPILKACIRGFWDGVRKNLHRRY